MNEPSEGDSVINNNKLTQQVDRNGNLVFGHETLYRGNQASDKIKELVLGFEYKKFQGYKKVLVKDDIIVLVKTVSYLGNPHPLYKKRIQIPKWWINFCNEYGNDFNIRFVGLYSYNDNHLIVDYDKTNYINNLGNNSSAHVYTTDLKLAVENGEFSKIDYFKNQINIFKPDNYIEYLKTFIVKDLPLIDLIKKISKEFPTEQIDASRAILDMLEGGSTNWKQTEWAGWYFEHLFKKASKKLNLEDRFQFGLYVGPDNLKLDIWFVQERFYGDLKAHSIDSSAIIGNDTLVVNEAIKNHNKLWYIIAEHERSKDLNDKENMKRLQIIYDSTGQMNKLPRRRIKGSIKFNKILILLIDKDTLTFTDQLQKDWLNSNGTPRKEKISLKKKYLTNSDLVIHSIDL